jgi:hypothetical protein
MIPNFLIKSDGKISKLFIDQSILDFKSACDYIQNLPIGRTKSTIDFTLVFIENKGTCSTKHAILNQLAEENGNFEIELMFGIFLMNSETHPILTDFFTNKDYQILPESHCFLRYKGERYDFTSSKNIMTAIENKIVREQRIEPQQVGEWKEKIHQDYLMRWLKRKAEMKISLEEIWKDREYCNLLLSEFYNS